MPELQLAGCTPVPIAAYLKGLAILRLVSEQVDPQARGWWANETFWLDSKLDRDALVEFLACVYRPTPILAPWNAGSGFYPHKTTAAAALNAIRQSKAERLSAYRRAIAGVDAVLARRGVTQPPDKELKTAVIAACRNELPDEVVEWIDAVVVLTPGGQSYPPILGTGGNDGNMEFTSNFMQRLASLFDFETGQPAAATRRWLTAALFADPVPGMLDVSIGQFYPGAAGGPNSSEGVRGQPRVNPWDYVLTMEGAVAFAAHATKRLGVHREALLSYPFTVLASAAGHGSVTEAEERNTRAEMWLPLWQRPARYSELVAVFREGRSQVGTRPARDGLDFARACAKLGVDRGIDSYQRYSFVMRQGRSYLAVPLSRVQVRRRPEADLADDLARGDWLNRLAAAAKGNGQAIERAHRRISEAVWQLTQQGGAARVQALLRELGKLERLLADRKDVREKLPPPVLHAQEWLERAWDGSAEFAVAAGLASLTWPGGPALRAYCSPVDPKNPAAWAEVEHPRLVWRHADPIRNLAMLAKRLMIDAEQGEHAAADKKPFSGLLPVPFQYVKPFLFGQTDDTKLHELFLGLLPLSVTPDVFRSWRIQENAEEDPVWLPWAYAITKLILTPDAQLRRLHQARQDLSVPVPQGFVAGLASGDATQARRAVHLGERRLFASGLAPVWRNVDSTGLDPRRVLAAALVPISMVQLRAIARQVLERSEDPVASESMGPH
jgi:CRISPR-associated protein Csx17